MVDVTVRKRFRKNGETMYEYRFEIATVDGKRQWKTKCGFKTATEARKAGRMDLQTYENAGRFITKDRMSVSDYFAYWISADCEIDLKPTTIMGYRKTIENLILPKLGSFRLKSLTREILQAFLLELYDAGYSQNTLVKVKAILSKSMNYAVDHHYIPYSPAVRVKSPKNRRPKIPTRKAPHYFIKPDIIEKIFKRFPERHPSHIPLKLGYECGLRIGEAFALCWEDIDFENKVIRINRQVQWLQDKERTLVDKLAKNGSADCGNGCWYFAPPKYDSYRIVEISDELAELLLREKVRQTKAMDYYNIYYTNYDVEQQFTFDGKEPKYPVIMNKLCKDGEGYPIHLVCIRDNGTYISPRTMQNVNRCIRKEISEEFDFHSLRKTHATMLAELGVNQKYIQTRLGHTNLEMTFDVYECTTDLMRQQGREVLNTIYT